MVRTVHRPRFGNDIRGVIRLLRRGRMRGDQQNQKGEKDKGIPVQGCFLKGKNNHFKL